ncbi:LysR family transcriptional regulator [Microbacterium sp. 2FI]|uniref:LysR family transcriptional regulator n=1 Tax=Microbacterium sp. 2FI TaxID=2502193 RepID=UPI0010F6617C|nr:LysR family transcriptional regulator [Microbacterium sp. 2FI]
MYDLHRLRLLREVSQRGTLAAVATALGFSPSAVSHQLTVLEREVGVPLLEPAGRGVRLTPAAASLVEHTEVILLEMERAAASIAASRSDVTGAVRVATFQTAAHAVIPAVLQGLSLRHPNLTLSFAQVSADAAIPALAAREFDVVLSERYPGGRSHAHPGVHSEEVISDPLSLATPASWGEVRLNDLADASWVMEHAASHPREWSTTLCRSAGYEPRVAFESADLYLHALLVAHGQAAALLPWLGFRPHDEIRLTPTGRRRSVVLSLRAGSESNPAIAAVRSALRQGLKEQLLAEPSPAPGTD